MKENLLVILKSNKIKFSKLQRRVGDYIIKYPLESSFITLETFASRLEISTTTVVRFCLKLGYTGFSELQKDLQDLVKERIAPHGRLEANLKTIKEDTLLAQCAQKSIENITLSQSLISSDICESTISLISTARKIYLIGQRTSYTVSYFLFQALNQILGNCHLIDPISGIDQLSSATNQDIVIAVSLPRYARSTLELVKVLKKQHNLKIISITDSYTAPLAAYSDILLPCHYASLSFHNSMSSALFIADYIVTAVAIAKKQQAADHLVDLEKILVELNFHID